MNILIRRTWQETFLAIVFIRPGEIREGEGRNLGEAVGNLVLNAPAVVATIDSIRWDMTHAYTRQYVATKVIKEIIYERSNIASTSNA